MFTNSSASLNRPIISFYSENPMAKASPVSPTLTFLILILLLTTTPQSQSLSYSQYRTLFSLAHTLMSRVANLRASKGDLSGANRARLIAEKLEKGLGLGFWKFMGSAGWDYVKNYAWRDIPYAAYYGAVSEVNELLRCLGELARTSSDAEKAAWLGRNYQSVLNILRSILGRFLTVFRESGTLREVVETVEREVVDGGLLRDCLELGSSDFIGLVQILRDLTLQFSPAPHTHKSDL